LKRTPTAAEDDGLTELEGFDAPPAPVFGAAEQAMPLVLPPAPDEPPVDLRSALANAVIPDAPAAVDSAHFVSPLDGPPVWLTGTIESAEESSGPRLLAPQDAALRYVRPGH